MIIDRNKVQASWFPYLIPIFHAMGDKLKDFLSELQDTLDLHHTLKIDTILKPFNLISVEEVKVLVVVDVPPKYESEEYLDFISRGILIIPRFLSTNARKEPHMIWEEFTTTFLRSYSRIQNGAIILTKDTGFRCPNRINLNAYIGEDWASQIPVNEFKTFTFHSAKIVEEICENKALQELIDVIRKKQRKSKIQF